MKNHKDDSRDIVIFQLTLEALANECVKRLSHNQVVYFIKIIEEKMCDASFTREMMEYFADVLPVDTLPQDENQSSEETISRSDYEHLYLVMTDDLNKWSNRALIAETKLKNIEITLKENEQ